MSALFDFDDAKKTLCWRIQVAYAGIKEPEVGVFEAVFSPPDYSFFSFAFAAFNFALNTIGGGTFLAGMNQKK